MSRKMMNKFITFLLLLTTLSLSLPVYASDVDSKKDKVTTDLRKGEKAPFDGVLLSLRLAAEVKENCSPVTIENRCSIRIEEAKKLIGSDCTQKLDVLKKSISACQAKHDEIIIAKDEYIKALESKLPKWYENPKLWFGVGLVIGGGTVFAIAKNVN